MDEVKKSSVGRETEEIVNDFVNRITRVFRRELKGLVSDEELEIRLEEFKNKVIAWPKDYYLAEIHAQGGYSNVDSLTTPAFVAGKCAKGEEYKLGTIFINIDALEGLDKRELLTILCHEGVHKLGPGDSIHQYSQPVPFHLRGKKMMAFLEIGNHLGPLSWKTLAYLPKGSAEDDLIPYQFLDVERNYEEGEWLLWETITDWFSNKLFLQLNSNYKQQSGYLRGLINQLVFKANNRNISLENGIKLALIKGDKTLFIKLLENTFGQNAYQDLVKMFKALATAYPVYLSGEIDDFKRFYSVFFEKFKKRFI